MHATRGMSATELHAATPRLKFETVPGDIPTWRNLLMNTLLVLLGLSAQALASDDKMTTGASCQPLSNTQLDSFYFRPTSVQNISSGMRYISCPVDIDSEGEWGTEDMDGGTDNGNAWLFLSFDYSQNTVGGTTTCTAQLIDRATNTFVETKTVAVVGTAGDPTVNMTISSLLKGDANSTALAFNCNLPSQVRLTTINIEEYAHTDDGVL
jgi:hypothetical protein